MTAANRNLPFLFLAFVAITTARGQATITQPYATAEEYIQEILLGEGVTAANITYTGSIVQLGYLENGGSVFSVEAGLMLNTDDATCEGFCGDCLGGSVGDQDLLDVANSVPPLIGESFNVGGVFDLCILEFDFEAGGDSISFNYVFGSDEYLTYVNTQYNDIFAFFLSGPGISGPYASPAGFPDGAINIAQVPESDPLLPVTISSVNNVTNSEYYVNNPNQDGICTNGYTTTFTAAAAVQCGETYHIKLAIADGSDTALESFVVLEAGSFSSNAVNLEADAVPFAANGLQNLVPYEESVGLPAVFNYPNGESFPFGAWSANNEMTVTVDGQETVVDAVIIEGCNDAQFTIIRPEVESDMLDTLYLGLEGSAVLGLDYASTFNQVVMNPGQTESVITLGVVDDSASEGVEYVEITYEYINGCGELITTTSRVVILDPLPIVATPSERDCINLDGTQVLGYDNISGYGPFRYIWDGNVWNNAWFDPSEWTVSFDSLFTMTNASGDLIGSHAPELVIVDQCGKTVTHVQDITYPVAQDGELCVGGQKDFPMLFPYTPVSDVLDETGVSILSTGNEHFEFDYIESGDHYLLQKIRGINSTSNPDTLILVDTCGYQTRAGIRVRECDIPNVFTPDYNASNDNFRIRGLEGFRGSRLLIYNRYGTVVYQDETASDAEFELVWNGRYPNGNNAPEGTYQWVLLRSDGLKDSGPLTLIRNQ